MSWSLGRLGLLRRHQHAQVWSGPGARELGFSSTPTKSAKVPDDSSYFYAFYCQLRDTDRALCSYGMQCLRSNSSSKAACALSRHASRFCLQQTFESP